MQLWSVGLVKSKNIGGLYLDPPATYVFQGLTRKMFDLLFITLSLHPLKIFFN